MTPKKTETTHEAGLVPAVLYTRVSTVKQTKEGTSLENQLERGTAALLNVGCYVVGIVSDEGVSGAMYLTRPGIQKALGMIEDGTAKVLCIAAVDRGARDVEAIRNIQKRVQRAGGRLLFADQGFVDNTTIGRANLTFQGASAEMIRGFIRDNCISGRFKKAMQGQQPSRNLRPYGYTIVQHKDVIRGLYPGSQLGQYIVHPEEGPAVQKIFQWYAEGESLRGICRRLYEEGIPTQQGKVNWGNGTLSRILKQRIYIGEAVFGSREWGMDEQRLVDGYKEARFKVARPRGEWVIIPAPPLVSHETWQTCVDRLENNQSAKGGNPRYKYLLSGMARCGQCGGSVTGYTSKGGETYKSDGIGSRYYRCAQSLTRARLDGTNCEARTINANIVDELTLDGICYALRQPFAMEEARWEWEAKSKRAITESASPFEDMCARLNARLETLAQDEKNTVKAQIAGIRAGADAGVYAQVLGEIATERANIKRDLSLMPTSPEKGDLPRMQSFAEVLTRLGDEVEANLRGTAFTINQKRELLATLIESVIPERINPNRGDAPCKTGKRETSSVRGVTIYLRQAGRPEDTFDACGRLDVGTRFRTNGARSTLRPTEPRFVIRVTVGNPVPVISVEVPGGAN